MTFKPLFIANLITVVNMKKPFDFLRVLSVLRGNVLLLYVIVHQNMIFQDTL